MELNKFAVFAALSVVAAPSLAVDVREAGPSTMFYVSMPLGYSPGAKDRELRYGLQLQGKRDYQAVNIDNKMFSFLPAGGLEAKWIVAGAVAAGAAVAVASKDKKTTSNLQTQQTQHKQAIESAAPACPTPITNPCKS